MKPKLILCLTLFVSGTLSFCFNLHAETSSDVRDVVAGNTGFAVDLYGKLRTGEGNIFFSPYSISTALAMTYGGARGETAKQMAQTLRFSLPTDDLHPAFAAMEADLNSIQMEGPVQLSIANSLWPQSGFAFRPDYLALCQKYYGASIQSVDYRGHAEAACKKINDWVDATTNHKIVESLKSGTVDGARLVLVDAVYFWGNWVSPFKTNLTEDEPFHKLPGVTITAPTMRQTHEFGYAEFPDLQVLELPYPGDVSMVVLLPRTMDGIGKLEAQLTAQNLTSWTTNLASRTVDVHLPKFETTFDILLADTLASMGMPDAFTFGQADFSGMDGQRDLFISQVIHKAHVKVDEEGTEADAATVIEVANGAVPMHLSPIPVFRADHPFLFLIRDNRTGSILFLGRIMKPTESGNP
jgi:serpin B